MNTRRSKELREQDDELLQQGSSQQKWGQGLFIVGGAAIAIGGVLATVGHLQESDLKKKDPKAWKLNLGPTSVGVSTRW